MNYLFVLSLMLIGCTSSSPKQETKQPGKETVQTKHTDVSTVESDKNQPSSVKSKFRSVALFDANVGWGYDIFEGSKLVIHQPTIPAIQGVQGFRTEEDALKVGDLMIQKLDKGMMPPTISIEEMQKLGVLN